MALRSPAVLAVAIALVGGVVIAAAPAALAILVPLGIGIPVLSALTRSATRDESPEARARLGRWVALALVAHLISGWLTDVTNFSTDAELYDRVARQLEVHWSQGLPFERLPSGKEGFFYMLAALYRVFGHYPAAGIVVNCVIAAGTVAIMYDTTKRMFTAAAAHCVAPLMFLPGFLVWTSGLMREASILLMIAIALNAAVRLSDRFGVGQFILMTTSLTLLFTLRANVALLLMASLLPALALSRRQLMTGLGTGVTVTVVVLVLVVGAGVGYSGYKLSAGANLEQVEVSRLELSTSAESGYTRGADVSTTSGALSYLPVGLTNFMLGPFPWQVRTPRQILALPDVFLWWMLLPVLWRGAFEGVRVARRKTLLLLVPAIAIAAPLSLLIGNYGTAIRERLQVIILLVPFIALGVARRRASRQTESSATVRSDALVGHAGP
ncbi:MAG TPA: hypothetical protein VNB24_08475 [Acidimicrobiales bacterium]|nr:hypothetical protein [Acidimicrobiales bacterium]